MLKFDPEKCLATFHGRQSQIRRTIMAVFFENKKSLSVPDLVSILKERNFLTINKTTVYRQLKFLLDKQVITGIEIAGSKHYQLIHQHPRGILFCTHCQKAIPLKGKFKIPSTEKISKTNHFKINNFSLLFFGLCEDCQKITKTSKNKA